MPITYCEKTRSFHLDAKDSSYVFGIVGDGLLAHYYYGPHIPVEDVTDLVRLFAWTSSNDPVYKDVQGFSQNISMMEYPTAGMGDFRPAALTLKNPKGHSVTYLRYVSHTITSGKPSVEGLPHINSVSDEDAQTLAVECEDVASGVIVTLYYTVFADMPVIVRRCTVSNQTDAAVDISAIASCSVSLPEGNYDAIHLRGHYLHEHMYAREALPHGSFTIGSHRGSSGHWHNPFLALASPNADEDGGDVYAFSYIYSGSFQIEVNRSYHETVRVNVGMDRDTFSWHLEKGECFSTPETVQLYTDKGIGEMSRILHSLYNEHLVRGEWKNKKRPLLINSWEAAYFDFTGDKLVSFAKEARKLGIEMLVMDDGWFSRRNDDKSSLGDWWVNEEKLGSTLGEFSRRIHAEGMKLGIWYEPEMVSPVSDLYREHPDWCLHLEDTPRAHCRQQYTLDMSRSEVRDEIFRRMTEVLDLAEIDYIKWDYNRPITEAFSHALSPERAGELQHRFILGSYELLERITSRYPHILLESCASGGGRFDPGILYYSPQAWASDNTDPVDRILIQSGLSLVYPASVLGSHVSANPRADYAYKGDIALSGSFGYELDPIKLSESERALISEQVKEYQRSYELIHKGELYRLLPPWENKERASWSYVAKDKSEAIVFLATQKKPLIEKLLLRMKGLDPDAIYEILELGIRASGARLMHAGVNATPDTRPSCDYESRILHVKRVKA